MRSLVLLLLAVAALSAPGSAQRPALPPVDSNAVVVFRLTDRSELVGRVVAADETSLTVVTLAAARVVLPKTSVAAWRIRPGRSTAAGFQVADPNTSRLFFGPTARTLEQGSGYFADYYLFFAAVGYGVHDRVMLSAGSSLIPGADEQLIYVAGKVGLVRGPNAAVAVGGFWATLTGLDGGSLGNGYGVVTLGSNDHAVTVMGGYPFTSESIANEPMFMVGGETRIGARTKFMTELWKLPETSEIPTVFGVRWFGDRMAVDFGFIYVFGTDTSGFPFVPWVDFAINW